MNKRSDAKDKRFTWQERLYRAANLVVKLLGCGMFAGLCWYAMRYTQFVSPDGPELSLNVRDSMVKNLLGLACAGVILALLYWTAAKTDELVQYRIKIAALAIAAAWVAVLSFWWIFSADRVPAGDQAFIYGAASYFLEGNYMFFGVGGYLETYPYQLGLVALTEFLFRFAGAYNYLAFEAVCACMAVGIVWLGWRIVSYIAKSLVAAVFYCISIMCCVPLVLYTSWVYGDIPSIFFSMSAFFFLLKYEESKKKRWLLFLTFALTLAVLTRQNSLIFVIAAVLAGVVHSIRNRDMALIAGLLLTVLVPQLAFSGICKMYEMRSGYEISDGVPKLAWVAMGLQENWNGYGWYSDYHRELYYNTGFDTEMTAAYAKQDIRTRLTYFEENPSYTVTFFREKILSQWNQPLYQAVYFNTEYPEDGEPPADSIAYAVKTWLFSKVLAFADRVQFIIFTGMFCYFAFAVKRDSDLLHHIPAIAVLGGFLFSVIWEAKARYIFPYFVMSFPFAAIGYWRLIQSVAARRASRQAANENTVIPFRKTA